MASSTQISRETHPSIFRAGKRDKYQSKGIIYAMRHFGWKQAVILTSTDPFAVELSFTLEQLAKSVNISITVIFMDDTKHINQSVVDKIKSSGCKIVIAMAMAHRLFENDGTFGITKDDGYTFILSDYLASFNYDNTFHELLHGSLISRPGFFSSARLTDIYQRAKTIELDYYCKAINFKLEDSFYVPQIYDTLQAMIDIYNNVYPDTTFQSIYEEAKTYVNLDGLSGIIDFANDEGTPFSELYSIVNATHIAPTLLWINQTCDGEVITEYCKKADVENIVCIPDELQCFNIGEQLGYIIHNSKVWPGEGRKYPKDGTEAYVIESNSAVAIATFIICSILFLIFITTAIIVFIFRRTEVVVKYGRTTALYALLAGLSISTLSFLVHIGEHTLPMCHLRIWTGHLGIGLVTITLLILARHLRVYRGDDLPTEMISKKAFLITLGLLMSPIIIIDIVWSALLGSSVLACEDTHAPGYIAIVIFALLTILYFIFALQMDKSRQKFNEVDRIKFISYIVVINGLAGVVLRFFILNSTLDIFITTFVFLGISVISVWCMIYLTVAWHIYSIRKAK